MKRTYLSRTIILVAILTSMMVRAFAENNNNARLLLSEDFSGFTSGTNKNIDTNIDTYTQTKGWLGLYIYGNGAEGGRIKVGNSSNDGILVTPPVNPTSGSITIYIEAAPYKANTTDYMVAYLSDSETADYLVDESNNSRLIAKDFDINSSYDPAMVSLTLPTVPSPINSCRVTFTTNSVTYIRSIRIYDGNVSLNDITTSLSNTNNDKPRSIRIYKLDGTQIENHTSFHGIYIKEGKKILGK